MQEEALVEKKKMNNLKGVEGLEIYYKIGEWVMTSHLSHYFNKHQARGKIKSIMIEDWGVHYKVVFPTSMGNKELILFHDKIVGSCEPPTGDEVLHLQAQKNY